MKQLILGIDGGDKRIFEIFDMPFIKSLSKSNDSKILTEDLHSRGWVEIISGDHASYNNGFYLRPLCNKSYDFTLSYSFSDLEKNKRKPLLWEVVENLGYSVGIMNVPTTYPAPKVNGFFVSGAGGGLTKVDGIPKEMCSDDEVRDILENEEYILDLRLMPSGIKDKENLFDGLILMMEKRVISFINLSKLRNIDFGFLVLRAPTVVTYLAMVEITRYKNGSATNEWKELLEKFFVKLDLLIKKLFDELSPNNFIITADHGVTDQKFHVNFNKFLSDEGFLNFKTNFKNKLKFDLKILKNKGYNFFGRQFQTPKYLDINYKDTTAFGNYYYNGLYINDTVRFGGPIKEHEIDDLTDKVCESFNGYLPAKKHNMKATPYRKNLKDRPYSDQLPDIWIEAPDVYYFLGAGSEFVQKNPFYTEIRNLKNAVTSMHSGIKSKHPVCIMSKGSNKNIQNDDNLDLTLIYKLSKRFFESL